MSDRIAQEYADGATNRVNGWTYDANGNVTAMPGGTAFNGVYDIENRLVEATRNGTVKYGYGADNRRIFESKRKIVAGGGDTIEEVVTWWSGQQRIGRYKIRWSSELAPFGPPGSFVFARMEQENVYFGSRPLTLGAETNVAVDRLGSVRRSGRDYFPYGQEAPSTTTGGKEKYGTYRHDGETDLSYADQRYYATGAGRFMTADPYKASAGAGDPGSWNRYGYVDGDPVNWRDPMGLAAAPPDGRDYGGDGAGGGFGDPMVLASHYYDSEGYIGGAASFLPGGGGGGQGGTGGGGGNGGSGLADRLRQLLGESLARVKKLLTDDCARAVGATNGADAIKKLNGTAIGFADLGQPTFKTEDGQTVSVGGPVARNWRMPLIGNIKLNSSINWEGPAKQAYILDGRKVTGDFLAGNAAKLGIRSVTPEQYMDLTILHELGHSFGMNSQDRDERPIWTNCFK